MNSTAHRTNHTARWHATQIGLAEQQADAYRRMIAAIEPLAAGAPSCAAATFAAEVARLESAALEFEAHIDNCIEAAVLDGYGPDDIEAAGRPDALR